MDELPKGLFDNDEGLSYLDYFDALPGIVSVQDRDLNILQTNSRLREFFGDPAGRRCYEVFKRRTEKCKDCPVEETFLTGKRGKTESVVTKQNGEEMPVMVYTSPIKNAKGEVVHVLELAADISDVKKLQRKVFRAQQRLKQFFNEVPCYVSVQDRDFKLVAANRMFQEHFGDEVGDFCYKVYKHRQEPCLECPVAKTFDDGLSHQSEEIVTSMSGTQYNVLVHTAPIRNDKGDITHVMEIGTNITPIRKLQSQLESTGLLISSISHSIKGLLTGLDGGMYLVNSGLKNDNKKRLEQGWDMVARNVEQIRSTVMNILFYAKEREPKNEEFPAADLANEVINVVTPRAKKNAVALSSAVDDSAGKILGDRSGLRSMLINLLENSLDACRVDQKKPDHRVSLSVTGGPDEVLWEITDNGIGMDRETREKMFTLFFSSKGMEGTGLGLFIANNIAHSHGGSIEVESKVDKGTRFVVRISRERSVESAVEHPDVSS
jgi:signal transduction histidine kinase